MMKWDGNATLILGDELRGKTIAKGDSSKKNAAPASSGNRQTELASGLVTCPVHTRGTYLGRGSSFFKQSTAR